MMQVAGDALAVAEKARERPIWRTGSPWGRCALRCSGVDNTRLASLPDFNWQFWRRARLYIHGLTCAWYDNRYGIGNPLCTATTRRRVDNDDKNDIGSRGRKRASKLMTKAEWGMGKCETVCLHLYILILQYSFIIYIHSFIYIYMYSGPLYLCHRGGLSVKRHCIIYILYYIHYILMVL